MAQRNQSVGALTEAELNEIRHLKDLIEDETVGMDCSNREAVLWAVRNEIERLEE